MPRMSRIALRGLLRAVTGPALIAGCLAPPPAAGLGGPPAAVSPPGESASQLVGATSRIRLAQAEEAETGGGDADPAAAGGGAANEEGKAPSGKAPPGQDRPRARPVPLERVALDVDLPVEGGDRIAETAAGELRRHGRIGPDDALVPAGRERTLGTGTLTRTRQEHKGIPVFAADVVVTSSGGRIVNIRGHPAPAVRLEATRPEHDYPATVALAAQRLSREIAAEDEGTLVIFAVDGGYRLAWLGAVVVDRAREQMVLDAETGDVLLRTPLVVHRAPGVKDAPPSPPGACCR